MNEPIHASRAAMALSGINRGWMLILGILMVVLGAIGLTMTYSLAVALLFWSGILAFIGGGGHLLDAFYQKGWGGVALHVFIGAIYILVGVLLTAMPEVSAFWLTKYIALALMATGVLRLLTMFKIPDWRGLRLVLFVSAIVSIGLGIYIFQLVAKPAPELIATAEAHAAWVRSWKWVIGLFVALELLTEGVALIAISLTGRSTTTA